MPSVFTMDPGDLFRMLLFALMRRFTEEVDQMLGQMGLGRGQQSATTESRTMFAPAVEMAERAGKLVVCVDLPGLSKDDVQVEITDDLLTKASAAPRTTSSRRDSGTQSGTMACSVGRFPCRTACKQHKPLLPFRMGCSRLRCPPHNGSPVAVVSIFRAAPPATQDSSLRVIRGNRSRVTKARRLRRLLGGPNTNKGGTSSAAKRPRRAMCYDELVD
jgi:hypothetical protein